MSEMKIGFEMRKIRLALEDILPMRLVKAEEKDTYRFKAIIGSIPEVGLVEPLVIQDLGGSAATVRAGVEQIRALLPAVAASGKRVPVPVSKLMLGLNCGGSDAWSGVTANPVLGVAVHRRNTASSQSA